MSTKLMVSRCQFIIFTILSTYLNVIDVNSAIYKEIEVIDDLPDMANFQKYLTALEKIIYFVNTHRLFVDLNLSFGIFLVNVNLKNTIQIRGGHLPANDRARLKRVVLTNDIIIRHFKKLVSKYIVEPDNTDPMVDAASLFENVMGWPRNVEELNVRLLSKTTFYNRKELEHVYFKWPDFKKRILESKVNASIAAAQADTCLPMLAQNPINGRQKLVHCLLPYICLKVIANGLDFGYVATSRLLYLILTRYGRGCILVSPEEDQKLMDSLCAKAYNEAEFISHHHFQLPDLMMEQMCLCTIEGHAQFLRRSWIDELLEFQSTTGCFNETRPFEEENFGDELLLYQNFTWQFALVDRMILGNKCNIHTTAVAAGMLAAAIRYILENSLDT